MKDVAIKAVVPANKDTGTGELSATITVKYAENLEEAKKEYGEEAILTNSFANWRVTVQSGIRTALKAGKSLAEIQAQYAGAKMGVASGGVRVDPIQAYLGLFQSATPAEQTKMLAELQARAVAAAKK